MFILEVLFKGDTIVILVTIRTTIIIMRNNNENCKIIPEEIIVKMIKGLKNIIY